MALAIILRHSARIQAVPNLFRCTHKINSSKSFTQLINGVNKESKIISKLNLTGLTKRDMSADHSKLWPIEKGLTIFLLGLTPLAFITPSTALDDILAISTVIHFHWGLESSVVDYVRPLLFGPVIPKLCIGLLYLISISTLGGLLYYNHHSIGIGNTVRSFWKIQK